MASAVTWMMKTVNHRHFIYTGKPFLMALNRVSGGQFDLTPCYLFETDINRWMGLEIALRETLVIIAIVGSSSTRVCPFVQLQFNVPRTNNRDSIGVHNGIIVLGLEYLFELATILQQIMFTNHQQQLNKYWFELENCSINNNNNL